MLNVCGANPDYCYQDEDVEVKNDWSYSSIPSPTYAFMACIRTLYTVRFIFDKQLHIIVTAVSRRYKVKTVSVMEAKVVCCKCKKRKSVVQLKLTAVQFHELKRFWRLRFLRPVGVGSLFWNATPCNFVHRCTCFAGNCCLYILGVHVPVKPCYITWQFHCVVSREDLAS